MRKPGEGGKGTPPKDGPAGDAGSTHPNVPQQGGAAVGGANQRKTNKRSSGSKITPIYGQVVMRAYPMTKAQIFALGSLGLATNLFFSLATGLMVYAVEVRRDVDMTPDMQEPVKEAWRQISNLCWNGGMFAGALAVVALVAGGWSVFQIMRSATFPGDAKSK